MDTLLTNYHAMPLADKLWILLGLFAQALFTARFIVQWLASERAGKSVMPLTFWFLSISGSTLLLIYAIHRKDPVFILGQAFGVLIYARNLFLIYREAITKKSTEDAGEKTA